MGIQELARPELLKFLRGRASCPASLMRYDVRDRLWGTPARAGHSEEDDWRGAVLQTTELFQLVLALTFAPLLARSLRLTSIPGRHFVLSALVLLTLSYVFTVVEGYWLHDLFNTLEHAALAGCGVLFAVAAWVSKAHWYRRGGAR